MNTSATRNTAPAAAVTVIQYHGHSFIELEDAAATVTGRVAVISTTDAAPRTSSASTDSASARLTAKFATVSF